MVCSLGTQHERQIFGDQFKTMVDTDRRSYGRWYTFKFYSHCGKTGHTIDTCYRNTWFSASIQV